MNYSLIKPNKVDGKIQYLKDGKIIAVFNRKLARSKCGAAISRRQFEKSIESK